MHGGRESVYKEGKAPHGWRAPHGGRESVYKEGPAWGSLRAVCALLQSFDFAHSRTAWGALQGTTNKAPQGGRESVCKEGTAWGALLRFRRGAPLPLCPPFTHTHTHTHTPAVPLSRTEGLWWCVWRRPDGRRASRCVRAWAGPSAWRRPVCVPPPLLTPTGPRDGARVEEPRKYGRRVERTAGPFGWRTAGPAATRPRPRLFRQWP